MPKITVKKKYYSSIAKKNYGNDWTPHAPCFLSKQAGSDRELRAARPAPHSPRFLIQKKWADYILIHGRNVTQICACTCMYGISSSECEYVTSMYTRREHNRHEWRAALNDRLEQCKAVVYTCMHVYKNAFGPKIIIDHKYT